MDPLDQAVQNLMESVSKGQIQPIDAERLLNAASRLRANVPTGARAVADRRPNV